MPSVCRFAKFQLLRAKLDIVMAKFNDCSSHLHVLSYVLSDHQGELGRRTSVKGVIPKKVKSKVSRTIRVDAARSDEEEEAFLKSQPLHMPESLSIHRHGNGCASPVAATASQRHEKVPPSWMHSVCCDCAQCQDLVLHGLSLQLLAVQSDACLQQGRLKEASVFTQLLLRHHDNVAEKAQNFLKVTLSGNLSGNGKIGDGEECTVLPSVYEHVLLDGYVMMSQLGALQTDMDTAEEWLGKAQELLDMNTRPHMVEAHTILAQLHYQMALSSVPWPRHDEDVAETVVEKLCAQIGRITITNNSQDRPGEFKTPLVTRLDTDMNQCGDGITQVKTSTTESLLEGERISPKEADGTVRNLTGVAPSKKRGRGTAQKLPVSIDGKSTNPDGESPEQCDVDMKLSKTATRVPVRRAKACRVAVKKPRTSRKCAEKPRDSARNGDDSGAVNACVDESAEVDNKLCSEDSRVTETAYSTPTRSRPTREGRTEEVVPDDSPGGTDTFRSAFMTKTPSSQRKKYVFTDSDDDDEVLKAPCSKPSHVAKNTVSRVKETSSSTRWQNRAVYVDGGGVNDEKVAAPSSKPGWKTRGGTSQSSTKTSTYRGPKICPEKNSSLKENETVNCATHRVGPDSCIAHEDTLLSRKGKVSKAAAKKATITKSELAQNLFNKTLTVAAVTNNATVYDFDCSDDGKTPARGPHRKAAANRKGRLTLKKKSGRRKVDSPEIETARNAQEDDEPRPTYDSSEVVIPDVDGMSTAGLTKADSKAKPARSTRTKRAVATRVTRSKTGFVEEMRQQDDEEDEDIGALIAFDEIPLLEGNDSVILADSWQDEVTGDTAGHDDEYRKFVIYGSHGIDGHAVAVQTIDDVSVVAMPTCYETDNLGVVTQVTYGPVSLDDSVEVARFGSDCDIDQPPIRRKTGRRRNGRQTDTTTTSGRQTDKETAGIEQGDKLSLLDRDVAPGDDSHMTKPVVTLPPNLPCRGELFKN